MMRCVECFTSKSTGMVRTVMMTVLSMVMFGSSGTIDGAAQGRGRLRKKISELRQQASAVQRRITPQMRASSSDVNECGPGNWRPLHVAVRANNADKVHELIRHNALVDAQGPFGLTPLHLAVLCDHGACAAALLAARADKEAETTESAAIRDHDLVPDYPDEWLQRRGKVKLVQQKIPAHSTAKDLEKYRGTVRAISQPVPQSSGDAPLEEQRGAH